MARTSIATDAFGGTLSNWTQINTGYGSMQITSGHVDANYAYTFTTTGGPGMVWSGTGTFSNDQYCKIALVNLTASALESHIAVGVRVSGPDGTHNGYFYDINTSDNGSSYATWSTRLWKIVSGTPTALGAAVNVAFVTGDTIEIEVVGNVITGFRNGVATAATATDSAISTGKPGIMAGSAIPAGDNFEGGDVTADVTGQPAGRRQLKASLGHRHVFTM